jgi:hypothetical protein
VYPEFRQLQSDFSGSETQIVFDDLEYRLACVAFMTFLYYGFDWASLSTVLQSQKRQIHIGAYHRQSLACGLLEAGRVRETA